ncbi:hypothetical protein GZ78_15490 [Endozoicomonas numazuensis]|uniref:Uncharacterized protein n=1 Tax=Endozoicomonas numazuensis TaxID=1137799 RepID=A0A081NFL0_9GAMM|nr:hypothetical protein GZ78_15490 [Endozoicomonas numazuensis]
MIFLYDCSGFGSINPLPADKDRRIIRSVKIRSTDPGISTQSLTVMSPLKFTQTESEDLSNKMNMT